MNKLLVQMQGSPRDPSYDEQGIFLGDEKVSFREFFSRQGIQPLEETLVTSCHGNLDLTVALARQIQQLADEGHHVVGMAQGGLYFALPGLVAAQAPTVPFVSVPLKGDHYNGLTPFLGAQLPTGTAAIGSVGVGKYQVAVNVAAAMLKGEFEGVYVHNLSDKGLEKLAELGVPILGEASESLESGLVVAALNITGQVREYGDLTIFAPDSHKQPSTLMGYCADANKSVYTRGDVNAAILAAKVIAMGDLGVVQALKDAAKDKAAGYKQRTITLDAFGGELE